MQIDDNNGGMMFIVLLEFSAKKSQAARHMEGHNEWIKRGFVDGVFLLAGGLQPNRGGGVLAHNTTRTELENRVKEDPFVQQDVVTAEIHEITPARTDERLSFMVDKND